MWASMVYICWFSYRRILVLSYPRIVVFSFCRCPKIKHIYAIADTKQDAFKFLINILDPYSTSGALPQDAVETSRCMAPGLFRACAQLHSSLWTSDLRRLNWNRYYCQREPCVQAQFQWYCPFCHHSGLWEGCGRIPYLQRDSKIRKHFYFWDEL